MLNKNLTQTRLKELLQYNPKTGKFVWRVNRRGWAQAGDQAGCTINGYWIICVDGERHLAHRLAWLYVYGYFPKEVDHKNRNRADNRIANLRIPPTLSQARVNSKRYKNNCSGFKGVSQYGDDRWRASIGYKDKIIQLGAFDTPKEAHQVYCYAGKKLYEEFFHDGT